MAFLLGHYKQLGIKRTDIENQKSFFQMLNKVVHITLSTRHIRDIVNLTLILGPFQINHERKHNCSFKQT